MRKTAEIVMLGAVGEHRRRQIGKLRGHAAEIGQTGGDHDMARRQCLAIVERKPESFRRLLERNDFLVFDVRHELLLEGRAVGDKRVERDRAVFVRIRQIMFGAEALEREAVVRIVQVRREPLRLEEHALGHLGAPALQRRAEDAEIDAARTQMRGDRKPIRTGSDDGDV